MTFFQRFFTSVLPAAWARDLEAESRSWLARCPCEDARSICDWGGSWRNSVTLCSTIFDHAFPERRIDYYKFEVADDLIENGRAINSRHSSRSAGATSSSPSSPFNTE